MVLNISVQYQYLVQFNSSYPCGLILLIAFVSFNLASDWKEWFFGLRIAQSLSSIPLKKYHLFIYNKIKPYCTKNMFFPFLFIYSFLSDL